MTDKILFVSWLTMDSLPFDISANFGLGRGPGPTELVTWNGFDRPDKESAFQFYAGKSWEDVLEHLRGLKHDPTRGGAYYLEEWSVLSREALPYYLRAHLEYLLETLADSNTDEEFVFFLMGQLYQVIHMHKGSPFNSAQTVLLEHIARFLADDANHSRFPYFCNDIKAQVAKFLSELHAHAG